MESFAGAGKAVIDDVVSVSAGAVSNGQNVAKDLNDKLNEDMEEMIKHARYGNHCGKDDNDNDDVEFIDPLDKACMFHDTCTSTNYADRSQIFKDNFPTVDNWIAKTGKNYGSCSCEKQSLELANEASCKVHRGWFRRWHCEFNKSIVVKYFKFSVASLRC